MTRNEIINEIATSPVYKRICTNIAKTSGLANDLFQEMMIIMLKSDYKKLEDVYNQSPGTFNYYISRLCHKMFNHKNHSFYIEYRARKIMPPDLPADNVAEKKRFERLLNATLTELKKIETEYNGQYPFEIKLLQAYIKSGSYRKLSKNTGIPMRSCHHYIQQIAKRIANDRRIKSIINDN